MPLLRYIFQKPGGGGTIRNFAPDAARRFWRVAMTHAELMLGELEINQKQYSQAAVLLLNSLDLYRKQPSVTQDRAREIFFNLARTYTAQGNIEKATYYRLQSSK